MARLPLTRASQLIQIASALDDHGGSARRVLSRVGWPDWYLEAPDALIPNRHIWQFMQLAARAAGDPALGHLVGAGDPVGALGSRYAAKLLGSASIYHELRMFCAHLNLQTSNLYAWLDEDDADHVWLCSKARFDHVGPAEMEQCNLMQLVQVVRLGAGPGWLPRRVRLRAGRLPGVETTPLLSEAEVRHHQQATAIAIPRAILAWPLRYACRTGTSSDTDGRDHPLPGAADLVGSIRAVVQSWLPHGPPGIAVVAEAAGLEVRTLQRRLTLEGVTFIGLVDRARFEAAMRLMDRDDARITDIAFDLGYADTAHFTRAFRRWAGVSPGAYRTSRLAS